MFTDLNNPITYGTIVSTIPPSNPIPNVTRWWNPNEQIEWVWNGTYWLSTKEENHQIRSFSGTINSSRALDCGFCFTGNYNIFVKRCRVNGRTEAAISPGGTIDSNSNYWTFIPMLMIRGNSATALPNAPTLSMQGKTYVQFDNFFLTSAFINTHVTVSGSGDLPDGSNTYSRGLSFLATKVGSSAPDLNNSFTGVITYQLARP